MRHRARINGWFTNRVGLVVMILALVSATQLGWFSFKGREEQIRLSNISNCQTRYNLALAEALQRRSEFSEQDRLSLVTFVREVAASKTRVQSRAALTKYLKIQSDLEDARKENPIPTLPPGKCI